jgi:ferric-dicitrate binding protein FerR (iron transport regulator)
MSQSLDDRTGYLLKQYIAGTCTLDEFNELLTLISIQPNGSVVEELLLEEVRNSRFHEAEEQVNWQQMLQTVLQQQGAAPAPVRSMPVFKRIAVAATIILCAGTIAFWWLKRTDARQVDHQPVATITDIMPGRNGAILTLQNGQTLVLDSAQNGALTMPHGLQIVKHDSLIAYAPTGTAIHEATAYNTLTTPRGRQFQVVLSDGTKVWLNASSSIHYPAVFKGKERVVEVTGEAYFEVAKDATKPFIVNIPPHPGGPGGGRVEVLGTHFNINAYDDEAAIRTTLLEGSVKASLMNGQSSILKPGDQAVVMPNTSMTTNHTARLDEVMAWKNGYFQFERSDIQTVMREIARWYDVDIQYEGAVTKDKFGGSIPRDATLSQVLHALEQSLVHFTIQGKKVIVTP